MHAFQRDYVCLLVGGLGEYATLPDLFARALFFCIIVSICIIIHVVQPPQCDIKVMVSIIKSGLADVQGFAQDMNFVLQ